MSNGGIATFNDPRRFGCMKLVARDRLDDEPLLRALGPEPLGNEFDAAMLAARLCRQEDQPEGGVARPARGGRARQHLCLRGAASLASVAEAQGLDPCRPQTARRTSVRARWSTSIRAVLNDAIKAGGSSLRDHRQTSGELGYFQHNFRVYDREGERARRPVAAARSAASCRPAARPSIVRSVRNDTCGIASNRSWLGTSSVTGRQPSDQAALPRR